MNKSIVLVILLALFGNYVQAYTIKPLTKKELKKIETVYLKYEKKYNSEKEKYGTASNTTFIYWDRAKAAYNYSNFISGEEFKRKYQKIERIRKNLTGDNTEVSRNISQLHYVYFNLLGYVDSLDSWVLGDNFEAFCREDTKVIPELVESYNQFIKVDSKLSAWLAMQK